MALKTYHGDLVALDKHLSISDRRIKIRTDNLNTDQCFKLYEKLLSIGLRVGSITRSYLKRSSEDSSLHNTVSSLYIYDGKVRHSASIDHYLKEDACHPWILSIPIVVNKYKDIWS